MNIYAKFIKPMLDKTFACFGIILSSPVILILSTLSFINFRHDIFFTQNRVGKSGKVFKLYKFRTMTEEMGTDGRLLPDEKRMTKYGRFLRSTSLDELPQLWNILKGDMSFIGPRPLLIEYLPLYTKEQNRRHEVTPGMSGWAQVNGRNNISWTQKFKLDVWYVDHISFSTDLKILFLTIKRVIKREDIMDKSGQAMPFFNGKN